MKKMQFIVLIFLVFFLNQADWAQSQPFCLFPFWELPSGSIGYIYSNNLSGNLAENMSSIGQMHGIFITIPDVVQEGEFVGFASFSYSGNEDENSTKENNPGSPGTEHTRDISMRMVSQNINFRVKYKRFSFHL